MFMRLLPPKYTLSYTHEISVIHITMQRKRVSSMDKLMLLSQISLFDELPMEELRIIDDLSEMRPVKKGTIITSLTNISRRFSS